MSQVFRFRRFFEHAPVGDEVTEYDLQHRTTYTLLLDAESEGVQTFEMTDFFAEDRVPKSRRKLLRVVESHLERAHWLRDRGFIIVW